MPVDMPVAKSTNYNPYTTISVPKYTPMPAAPISNPTGQIQSQPGSSSSSGQTAVSAPAFQGASATTTTRGLFNYNDGHDVGTTPYQSQINPVPYGMDWGSLGNVASKAWNYLGQPAAQSYSMQSTPAVAPHSYLGLGGYYPAQVNNDAFNKQYGPPAWAAPASIINPTIAGNPLNVTGKGITTTNPIASYQGSTNNASNPLNVSGQGVTNTNPIITYTGQTNAATPLNVTGAGATAQGADKSSNAGTSSNGLAQKWNPTPGFGPLDTTDADWNHGLPYKAGGYDLAEIQRPTAAKYTTGFNYANNFPGSYFSANQGSVTNPLPQIAGYYVYGGKYYPIDLKRVAQITNNADWRAYNSGHSGGGWGDGGSSAYNANNSNSDWFQNMLNWKI